MALQKLREAWPWTAAAAAALAVVARGREHRGKASAVLLATLYQILMRPVRARSADYHDPTSSRYKALRRQFFPPGFPNGWHCVCNASDLEGGRVKSISALGTHMVAFRGEDGKVGVLDAFCAHLGAHLGSGGEVVGSLLRCPFHGWMFDQAGQCKEIPYCPQEIPETAKIRAYEVREVLERILIWFDAEGRPPAWEPAVHLDVEQGLRDGSYYLGSCRALEFDQHVCEMAMNSADPFHFKTLHAPLPIPFVGRFISGEHNIKQWYEKGVDPGTRAMVHQKHLGGITESSDFLYIRGPSTRPFRWKIPFSNRVNASIRTGVTFEGPSIIHYTFDTPLGIMRLIQTLTTVEPFKVYSQAHWYAQASVPRFVVQFFAMVATTALEQDRPVWENKMYRAAAGAHLVAGDGPFAAFMRWYGQFYSASSGDVGRLPLEW